MGLFTNVVIGRNTYTGKEEQKLKYNAASIVVSSVLALIVIIAACMWIFPQYGVWQASLSGKSVLAEAEYSRQAIVCKARAERESAVQYAQAESIRAVGAHNAVVIISTGLTPNYLQYLAIQSQKAMADSPNHSTIYIKSFSKPFSFFLA